MRQAIDLAALESWIDAGLGLTDWSAPLSLSVPAIGATALALAQKSKRGALRLLGSSLGAPIEFLNLCRELGDAALAPGAQERYVAGVGRLAWSAVSKAGVTVIVFALFEEHANLDALHEHALIGERCVSSRLRHEDSNSSSSLKSAVLAHLPLGIAIFDLSGGCRELNDAARSVLARADGLVLRGNELACCNPSDNHALKTAIAATAGEARDVFVRVSRRCGATPYVLRVIGLPATTQAARHVLLMIVDPDVPPSVAPEIWRAMFNLTECEIMVAAALVSGGNVTDLARQRGVAVDTVRQQKKSMLARLDVSSQAAAAAMLSRVALFAPCETVLAAFSR